MNGPPPGVEILFEDDDLIAVGKPAGLPTANAPRGAPSLYRWLLDHRGRAGRGAAAPFVGIVSRLDAPVSGVVVAGLNPRAAARLAEQFRSRSVEKTYVALVAGRFPAPLGHWIEWHDAIARGPEEHCSRVRIGARGDAGGEDEEEAVGQWKDAQVQARVVRRGGEVSLVELRPLTGRRHQLRAQLAAHGCPIVGDRRYGARLPFPAGIGLHSRRLALAHPATGVALGFEAKWPAAWLGRYAPLVAAV